MKFQLIGHDYRYAAEQSLLVFFPEEAHRLVESIPKNENSVVSTLNVLPGRARAEIFLRRDGRSLRAQATVNIPSDAPPREVTRLQTQAVKRSFYRAACRFTGVRPLWGDLTGIRPAQLARRVLERGGSPAEARRHLETEHSVAPERAELCVAAAQAAADCKKMLKKQEISLYVGIPFCPTRCLYCSFVSQTVARAGALIPAYLEALAREIEAVATLTRTYGLRPVTLYVGGGTPTTLTAPQLAFLMDTLARHVDISHLWEYTVEAGRPDTVDDEKFSILRNGGVTRVSVNPQTMSDEGLRRIGRPHTADDVRRAYGQARRAGFDCVNMDLIAGLPGDTPAGFSRTLTELLSLAPEQITLHTLARKRGSALSEETMAPPEPGVVEAMLAEGFDRLRGNGYGCYYLYRQKFMAGACENTGWRRDALGLYNLCMMEELHSVLSVGAGGVTKLVDPQKGRIERLNNPKFAPEYLENFEKNLPSHQKGIADFLDSL